VSLLGRGVFERRLAADDSIQFSATATHRIARQADERACASASLAQQFNGQRILVRYGIDDRRYRQCPPTRGQTCRGEFPAPRAEGEGDRACRRLISAPRYGRP